MRKLRLMILAGATVALFGGATLANATHTAQGVTHTFIAGNARCSTGTVQIKVEPVVSGTYGGIQVVVSGSSFSWTILDNTSTGLDANVVLVKGGPNTLAYSYPNAPDGLNYFDWDSGLTANINPNNDKPYGLSHITFCFDPKA